MLQQTYATLRDLDELGVALEALSMLAAAHKRRALRAASGRFAPYLRKRYQLPLRVELDDVDASGLTLGAAAAVVAMATGPVLVQDVVVKVAVGGVAGALGVTVQISTDAGATFGTAAALASSGALVLDGVQLTLSGTLAANDTVSWSTHVDAGVVDATVAIAVFILLHNRGTASAPEQDLMKARKEEALQFAKDLATGDAFLEASEDATPDLDEAGPFGDGQEHPWDFLEREGA